MHGIQPVIYLISRFHPSSLTRLDNQQRLAPNIQMEITGMPQLFGKGYGAVEALS